MKHIFLSLLVLCSLSTNDLGAMKRKRVEEQEEDPRPLKKIKLDHKTFRISDELAAFKREKLQEGQTFVEITQETFPELKALIDDIYHEAQKLDLDAPEIKYFVLFESHQKMSPDCSYAGKEKGEWKVMLGWGEITGKRDACIPFIIAHEIAHILLRHPSSAGGIMLRVISICIQKISCYCALPIDVIRKCRQRLNEHDADAIAAEIIGFALAKAGIEELEYPFGDYYLCLAALMNDGINYYNARVMAYFNMVSHPSNEDRIKNIEKYKK